MGFLGLFKKGEDSRLSSDCRRKRFVEDFDRDNTAFRSDKTGRFVHNDLNYHFVSGGTVSDINGNDIVAQTLTHDFEYGYLLDGSYATMSFTQIGRGEDQQVQVCFYNEKDRTLNIVDKEAKQLQSLMKEHKLSLEAATYLFVRNDPKYKNSKKADLFNSFFEEYVLTEEDVSHLKKMKQFDGGGTYRTSGIKDSQEWLKYCVDVSDVSKLLGVVRVVSAANRTDASKPLGNQHTKE